MLPSPDLILDGSMIPSLPPLGGSIDPGVLMGRSKLHNSNLAQTSHDSVPSGSASLSSNFGASRIKTGGNRSSERIETGDLMDRPASHEGVNRGRVGVGAIGMSLDQIAAQRSSSQSPPNPSVSRDTQSLKHPLPRLISTTNAPSRSSATNKKTGHGRTWSDSTHDTRAAVSDGLIIPPPRKHSRSNSMEAPTRSSSLIPPPLLPLNKPHPLTKPVKTTKKPIKQNTLPIPSGIELIQKEDDNLTQLLKILESLIPKSRSAGATTHYTHLDPLTLLTPLALTLEALVLERQHLRNTPSSTHIPPLQSGLSLHLPTKTGELNWEIMHTYTTHLGYAIDEILPYIRDSNDQKGVEDVLRQVRIYVGKIRKVLGEVGEGYEDCYGYLRGWWDESGMEGTACEVNRWGDLFDA